MVKISQGRYTQMVRYMKKCSRSPIIREMQVKTTVRYILTPVRIPIIKKTRDNKCWQRCGENGIHVNCWWEWKLVQSLWKAAWCFLKNLNLGPLCDPATPLLGICPKEIHLLSEGGICIPIFLSESFTTAKVQKQPKCLSVNSEQIQKI